MSEFYLTLPSTASPRRYPNNKNNSFKVVLPQPLTLTGEWEVALASISLPEGRKPLNDIVGTGPLFQEVVKGYWSQLQSMGRGSSVKYTLTYTADDVPNYQHSTGVSFMKGMISKFKNERTHTSGGSYNDYLGGISWFEQTADGQKTRNWTEFADDGERDQLGIQNRNSTINDDNYFLIKKELAHKMGWIIPPDANGIYKLGPNLICTVREPMEELPDYDNISLPRDVRSIPPTNIGYMFYESVVGYYKFSRNVNWEFINLNSAYDAMTRGAATTLYVYSDVCKKSIVGDQFTDFIREVPYFSSGAGEHYFEPITMRHLPVQRNYLETVEIEISSDHSAQLAELGNGATTVVLHFRKKQ